MKIPYLLDWKKEWIAPLCIAFAFIGSIYFYVHFPEQVATHWNLQGQPDDWSGKTFAAFFFPILILGIYILLIFLPLFDPLRKRYEEFSKTYQIIRFALVTFFTGIYFLASLSGLGYNMQIGKIIPAVIGLLFVILGNYMPKIKKTGL